MRILLRKLTSDIPSHWMNIAYISWGSTVETADIGCYQPILKPSNSIFLTISYVDGI